MRFAPIIEKLPDAWAYRSNLVQYQVRNWTYLRTVKRSPQSGRKAIGTTLAIRLCSLILLTIAAGPIDNAMQTSAYGVERLAFMHTISYGNMALSKDYIEHVLKWEGPGGSDPRDPASACYPGGVHTIKGVTYCTFKKYATKLGISPVTHDRFLKLSNAEAVKFMELFFANAQAGKFRKAIGLSMVEVSWMSGPSVAVRNLQTALKKLGKDVQVTGRIDQKTINAANLANQQKLFDAFWAERMRWLQSLSKWSVYGRGWTNRKNAFVAKFAPSSLGNIIKFTALGAVAWIATDKIIKKTK